MAPTSGILSTIDYLDHTYALYRDGTSSGIKFGKLAFEDESIFDVAAVETEFDVIDSGGLFVMSSYLIDNRNHSSK